LVSSQFIDLSNRLDPELRIVCPNRLLLVYVRTCD
jgi:hypothetical protein